MNSHKKYILVFSSGSWHWAPKSLAISWVIGTPFVLMRWLLVSPGNQDGNRLPDQDQGMVRSLGFSAQPLPPPRKGTGAGDWVHDQSCLHDEASINIPRVRHSESFWVSEHIHELGKWHTAQLHETEVPALGVLPGLTPSISSSGCSAGSFIISFITWYIGKYISMRSVSCSSKCWNLRRESWTSDV